MRSMQEGPRCSVGQKEHHFKKESGEMKIIFAVIGGILAVLVIILIGNFFGLYTSQYFAPKFRQVDQQVFEQSEQYNEGMIRDLDNLRDQYLSATGDEKLALKATIIHRFEVYDPNKLPNDLRSFYEQLTRGDK